MRYFINRILIFILSIIILIGLVIMSTNIKINNKHIFNLSKNIKFIILGHSHPEGAFNDSLIANSKNLAQSGELYFYTYLKTKKILSENKQIKIVFLEFTNNEIINDMEKWTTSEDQLVYRIPKYAPIMNKDDYQYIIPKNPIAFLKAMPVVFRNNMNTLVFNYKDYMIANDWGKYFYNNRHYVDSLLKSNKKIGVNNDYLKINNINLFYLNKIIKYCKNNHVELYLMRSPFHKEEPVYLANESKFSTILKTKFAKQTFLDFKNFPLLNNEYGDLDHLNYKGSKKFSLFFNNLLKHGLLKMKDKQQFINKEMQKLQN